MRPRTTLIISSIIALVALAVPPGLALAQSSSGEHDGGLSFPEIMAIATAVAGALGGAIALAVRSAKSLFTVYIDSREHALRETLEAQNAVAIAIKGMNDRLIETIEAQNSIASEIKTMNHRLLVGAPAPAPAAKKRRRRSK